MKAFFGEVGDEDFNDDWLSYHKTVDKSHGRIDVREYYHSDRIASVSGLKRFADARSIGMLRAKRIIGGELHHDAAYCSQLGETEHRLQA